MASGDLAIVDEGGNPVGLSTAGSSNHSNGPGSGHFIPEHEPKTSTV